ncbi:MAG: hypothetical protein PHZ19_01655 [Candidatus Thermoplasmatota archaeon]|nr:hypothetical protein [Candidatus Thermoplasmatota archaeon]
MRQKITNISSLLQEIIEELEKEGEPNGALEPRIRFPIGFIRKAAHYRRRCPCYDAAIAKNISYTLQFHDVLRWLLNWFDIGLTAQEMVIKHGIVAVAAVIEAIEVDELERRNIKAAMSLKRSTDKLQEQGIITDELAKKIQDLRKTRDNLHLQSHIWKPKKATEPEIYKIDDWNNAISILNELLAELGRRQ